MQPQSKRHPGALTKQIAAPKPNGLFASSKRHPGAVPKQKASLQPPFPSADPIINAVAEIRSGALPKRKASIQPLLPSGEFITNHAVSEPRSDFDMDPIELSFDRLLLEIQQVHAAQISSLHSQNAQLQNQLIELQTKTQSAGLKRKSTWEDVGAMPKRIARSKATTQEPEVGPEAKAAKSALMPKRKPVPTTLVARLSSFDGSSDGGALDTLESMSFDTTGETSNEVNGGVDLTPRPIQPTDRQGIPHAKQSLGVISEELEARQKRGRSDSGPLPPGRRWRVRGKQPNPFQTVEKPGAKCVDAHDSVETTFMSSPVASAQSSDEMANTVSNQTSLKANLQDSEDHGAHVEPQKESCLSVAPETQGTTDLGTETVSELNNIDGATGGSISIVGTCLQPSGSSSLAGDSDIHSKAAKPEADPAVEARAKIEEEQRAKAVEQATRKAREEAIASAAEFARGKEEEVANLRAEEETMQRIVAEENCRARATEEARVSMAEDTRIKAEEKAKADTKLQANVNIEREARATAIERLTAQAREDANVGATEDTRAMTDEKARHNAEEIARQRSEEETEIKAEEKQLETVRGNTSVENAFNAEDPDKRTDQSEATPTNEDKVMGTRQGTTGTPEDTEADFGKNTQNDDHQQIILFEEINVRSAEDANAKLEEDGVLKAEEKIIQSCPVDSIAMAKEEDMKVQAAEEAMIDVNEDTAEVNTGATCEAAAAEERRLEAEEGSSVNCDEQTRGEASDKIKAAEEYTGEAKAKVEQEARVLSVDIDMTGLEVERTDTASLEEANVKADEGEGERSLESELPQDNISQENTKEMEEHAIHESPATAETPTRLSTEEATQRDTAVALERDGLATAAEECEATADGNIENKTEKDNAEATEEKMMDGEVEASSEKSEVEETINGRATLDECSRAKVESDVKVTGIKAEDEDPMVDSSLLEMLEVEEGASLKAEDETRSYEAACEAEDGPASVLEGASSLLPQAKETEGRATLKPKSLSKARSLSFQGSLLSPEDSGGLYANGVDSMASISLLSDSGELSPVTPSIWPQALTGVGISLEDLVRKLMLAHNTEVSTLEGRNAQLQSELVQMQNNILQELADEDEPVKTRGDIDGPPGGKLALAPDYPSTIDSWNRRRDWERVQSELGVNELGDHTTQFADPKQPDVIVGTGYIRVLCGDHGPYIEFAPEHVHWESFPKVIRKRAGAYYDEHYTATGKVKAYEQRRTVRNKPNPPAGEWSVHNNRPRGYADYRIGCVYMSCDALQVFGEEPNRPGRRTNLVESQGPTIEAIADMPEEITQFMDTTQIAEPLEPEMSPEEEEDEPVEGDECPRCGTMLEWSDYAEGQYAKGWLCDCGESSAISGAWRWFCKKCSVDVCETCMFLNMREKAIVHEKGPQEDVPLPGDKAMEVCADAPSQNGGSQEHHDPLVEKARLAVEAPTVTVTPASEVQQSVSVAQPVVNAITLATADAVGKDGAFLAEKEQLKSCFREFKHGNGTALVAEVGPLLEQFLQPTLVDRTVEVFSDPQTEVFDYERFVDWLYDVGTGP